MKTWELLLLLLATLDVSRGQEGAIQGPGVAKATASGDTITSPPMLVDRQIPILKMLWHKTRHFDRSGRFEGRRRPRITLVYHATLNSTSRWFGVDAHADNGEIKGWMPLEGNANYEIRVLQAGDVSATTLYINSIKRFPLKFETVITTNDGSQQYQYQSVLAGPVSGRKLPVSIDSPEWTVLPPPDITYNQSGSLMVECKSFVPHEKSLSNELWLRYMKPEKDVQNDFKAITMIYKETPNVAEQYKSAKLQLLTAEREEWPINPVHVVYKVQMTVNNVNKSHEGIYQCAMEREFDKAYAISYITMSGQLPLISETPYVTLLPCNSRNFRGGWKKVLTASEGRPTCLRCRAEGRPRPNISVRYAAAEVRHSPEVSLTRYVNVADGGYSEVTIIFRRKFFGERRYECHAINDNGRNEQEFYVRYN